ncbi:MAG: IMS domain-containing protein [Cyanobacteria bacterium P01_A01_bin.135]
MQIPLDYYRILGLPIQATEEQLQNAHRDRMLQLPRREYSEVAIAARRQLIDEAYEVLSDPARRQVYDAKFLASSYPSAAQTGDEPSDGDEGDAEPALPSIEIDDKQLIGALLILLELGEYELVLKLGRPYLSSGSSSLESGQFGDPSVVGADIVLTLALACLELGREQWHQNQYENAAESLETGLELLVKEGLFAGVRGEMQTELFKLRPYRILELLGLPEEQDTERYRGFRLLQTMLQERGGIDGSGNDRSGLSTDDFLRFIQQLRSYLTVAEQQTLFEAEAKRPSAVAAYLAVYALIAGGFAYQQPALIQQAKTLLAGLAARQDVSLERAVCCLLLGQTAEANQVVQQSQDTEALSVIRRQSKDSPDLLPGLCYYTERWLQKDVFPYFRDLAARPVSLKTYFADPKVQAYLEALPEEPPPAAQPRIAANGVAPTSLEARRGTTRWAVGQPSPQPVTSGGRKEGSSLQVAEREPRQGSGRRRVTSGSASPTSAPATTVTRTSASSQPAAARPTRGKSLRLDRLLLLGGAALLALLLLWLLLNRFFNWLDGQFANPLPGEQLELTLTAPVVTIPDPPAPVQNAPAPDGELTQATAESVVQGWFAAKGEALGEAHNLDALATVLTGDLLARWEGQASIAASDGWYWQYNYPTLDILEVSWSEETPDLASIDVAVTEDATFHTADGAPVPEESYTSDLQVRYSLIREADTWKIEAIELL